MITLVVRALMSLARFFGMAEAGIMEQLQMGRANIRQFKNVKTSENLPKNPPMPDVKLGVEGVNEALDLLEKTQIEVERVLVPQLKSHATSLCNDLIAVTPPLAGGVIGTGGTPAAIKSGRAMVEKQIKSMFKPTQSMLFGHLVMAREWQAVGNYKWTPTSEGMIKDINNRNWKGVYARFKARGWEPDPTKQIVHIPTPALHRAGRDKSGRVAKTYYVRQGVNAINAFIRQKMMLIGKMISGWVDARDSLGSIPADGVNSNFKSLGMGSGKGTVLRQGKQSKVTITNLFGDVNGVLTQTGKLQYLLTKRRINLLNGIKNAVDKAVNVAKAKAKKPRIKK